MRFEPGEVVAAIVEIGVRDLEHGAAPWAYRQRLAEDRSLVERWNDAYRAHHARLGAAGHGLR